MTTKQRIRERYRIELRERDHGPPHVHVTGGGVDMMVLLETLETRGSCPAGVKQEALEWIETHRVSLLKDWKQWHP